MSFDILSTNLLIEETAEMILVHPVTGVELSDPKDETKVVKFILVSPSNPKHRKAVEVLQKAENKRGKRPATNDEKLEESINFLVALSVKVENMEYNGLVIDNAETFKEMYSNKKLGWITEQVSEFLRLSENFIQA